MAVKTDTILMLGGLGLLGFGMFYFMNKQAQSGPEPMAVAATDQLASDLNVKSDAQYMQMMQLMQSTLAQLNTGGLSKQQAQQQLIAGYVNMGVGAAAQIAGAVSSIIGAL